MLVSELYDIQIKNWEKRHPGVKWEGHDMEEVNEKEQLNKINGLFKQPQAILKNGESFTPVKQMQKPFDVGIKGFKRLLKDNKNLSKSQKNAAVRAYKARITERLREVATEYQKGLDKDKEV